MFFISIFKRESRRSGKDRRKTDNPKNSGNIGQERRARPDRRCNEDRRVDIGRRSGMYYKLPDKRKDLVDSIVNLLEQEDMRLT